MAEPKYRELRVEIRDGITLIIDVASRADVDAALAALADFNLPGPSDPKPPNKGGGKGDNHSEDTPDQRIETRAAIPLGSLKRKDVLVVKDGIPQLLRPNTLSVSDAAVLLMFAIEAGTRKPSATFDEFKAVYDQQNIKSGSPLSMLLSNLKNTGYLDKAAYAKDRTVRLTGKGEKKAAEVLTSLVK